MLTEEQMITICRRVEDIAKKYAFKVTAVSITAYRFGDANMISLYARINEEDEECFCESISSNFADQQAAETVLGDFERFLSMSVEG